MQFNQHASNHLQSQTRCNKDGKCVWNFPCPIKSHTELDQYGWVQYRQRQEKDCMTVSYMSFLTQLLHYHVNINITSSETIFLLVISVFFFILKRCFNT
jgi:hypothetical protein